MRTSQKQQVKNLLEYFRQIGDPVIENEIQCALKEIFSSLIETITQIIHTFYLYGKKSIVKNEFLKEITNSNFISKLCNIQSLWCKRQKELNLIISTSFIEEFCSIETNIPPIKESQEFLKYNAFELTNHYCKYSSETTSTILLQDALHIQTDDLTDRKKSKVNIIQDNIEENIRKTKECNMFRQALTIKTGNVDFEGCIIDSVQNGYGTVYNEYGGVKYQGEFVNGLLDGDNCLEYYDNGILYRCGQYKDNIPNGYIYEYYPTGVLKRQGVFVNGILNGSFCKEYHEAGNLKFKGAMENGMYNGASLIYYKSGLLKYCGNCKNGLPEGDNALIFNNKNGNIKYQGSLLNGLYHGQGQLYNDSKSSEVPIYDGLFIKGKFVDGKVYTFHPNNNVEYYGNFKNGNFEGRGIMYHATGKRMYHGKYKKGLEHNREVVIYDENGNISLICDEIADGKIIGGVEAYAKNDKDVAYEGTYNDQARMSIEKDVFPIEMMTQQRPKKKQSTLCSTKATNRICGMSERESENSFQQEKQKCKQF